MLGSFSGTCSLEAHGAFFDFTRKQVIQFTAGRCVLSTMMRKSTVGLCKVFAGPVFAPPDGCVKVVAAGYRLGGLLAERQFKLKARSRIQFAAYGDATVVQVQNSFHYREAQAGRA